MMRTDACDLLATAVLMLDAQGRVEYANSAAEELLGLSRRQLAGMPASALFETDGALDAQFLRTVRERYGVLRLEARLRRGRSGPAAGLVLTPLNGGLGAVLEVRPREHPQLDRARQLGKELAASRESLRNLAHEIKNPLGGLRGAAQLLQARLPEEGLRDYTRVIIAEADRLAQLVDRLVGPQAGGLEKSRFNIHEICERVHVLARAEFAPRVEFARDYDASVPELEGDRGRLTQALLNLVRNAAQAVAENASASGPRRVLLRTRIGHGLAPLCQPARSAMDCAVGNAKESRAENTGRDAVQGTAVPLGGVGGGARLACASGMSVVVSVIDNGPGVPPGLRDRLFHPLVTGRARGTGLGLSLAQEFAQQHGGLVEFESETGHTEFHLILPLEPR